MQSVVHRRPSGQAYSSNSLIRRDHTCRAPPCGNMRHRPHAHRPGPTQPDERRHRRRTPQRSSTRSPRRRARGADLLVTPEMAIPGYCIGDLVEDAGFLAANERAMQRVAAAATSLTAIVGFIDHDPSAINEAARSSSTTPRPSSRVDASSSGRTSRCCRTIATSTTSAISRPHRRATPSTSSSPGVASGWASRSARTCGTRTMPSSRCLSWWRSGAELLVNINASPFYPGKRHERDAIIRQHVARFGKPFVYVNTSGAADNGKNIIPFDGESLVYDGRRAPAGDRPAVRRGAAHRRPGSRRRPRRPSRPWIASGRCTTRWSWPSATTCARPGSRRAVVAVSGGIDSALALAIAVDALGADRVSAFNMPSQFNTDTTRSIAADVSRALGVHYGVIPIQDIADQIQRVFEASRARHRRGFTRENLQARIRGILMMAESNDTGALLISCGNETEIALGYATLYGDMCGGISLIGDLSKIDVYRLARHVNGRHGSEKIPEAAFHHRAVGRARGQPVRPVRLRGRRAARRRDGRTPAQPGRPTRRSSTGADSIRTASSRMPMAGPFTTNIRQRRSRPSSTTRPAGCAGQSTNGSRAHPSSSSQSARSASISGRRSSMAGLGLPEQSFLDGHFSR